MTSGNPKGPQSQKWLDQHNVERSQTSPSTTRNGSAACVQASSWICFGPSRFTSVLQITFILISYRWKYDKADVKLEMVFGPNISYVKTCQSVKYGALRKTLP